MGTDIGQEYHRQSCTRCPLAVTRQTIVWGTGDLRAPIVVVGSHPGQAEDAQGLPFVGPAGELLDRIWREVELPREQLFLTLLSRCYPGRRTPNLDEREACAPFFDRELAEMEPRVLVAVGRPAYQALTQSDPLFMPLVRRPLAGRLRTIYGVPSPGEYLRMPAGRERAQLLTLMLEDWRLVGRAWGHTVR
jgi:uracil-DNA glycosylase family 4